MEGLVNGVCLLPHKLSHHHYIFRCKSLPIYTMEVNSFSTKIEKFNGRLCTISLTEFKAILAIMVYKLKFKYGANYTEVFVFKQLPHYVYYETLCRNLSLGFAIKARACKGEGQEGSSGVTSHAPGSVRECEGMNFHTSK
jgi:hypothetical protein